MNLQENINRIKEVMGIIKEDAISFPITKSGSYTAPLGNCDRLHAFNDTHGQSVGKMNDTINPILMEVYNAGYNPDITDVSVEITKGKGNYTVNWSVTIEESKDDNAWVGIYSRGHGGTAEWVFTDVSTTKGHASINSCKESNYIKKRGSVDKMVLVEEFEFNKDKKLSGCQVKQLFYKYTLKEYPSLEKKSKIDQTKNIPKGNVPNTTMVDNTLKKDIEIKSIFDK